MTQGDSATAGARVIIPVGHQPGKSTAISAVSAAYQEPPPKCTVDGKAVAELAVLIKPVAFLVTVEHGTHELTRVFWHGGKFSVGVDTQRLGGIGIKHVDYATQGGLRITWDHGYEMFIPSSHCQATWKLPG